MTDNSDDIKKKTREAWNNTMNWSSTPTDASDCNVIEKEDNDTLKPLYPYQIELTGKIASLNIAEWLSIPSEDEKVPIKDKNDKKRKYSQLSFSEKQRKKSEKKKRKIERARWH